MSGLFITLEGGEGSGKSTIARLLADKIRDTGRAVTLTEEPTGTALGKRMWEMFQARGAAPVSPTAELLLFEAARAQHVAEVVRPALERGEVVVCDRYSDSSVAYQGFGRELGREVVIQLNEVSTGGIVPDLTLLLEVPLEVGLGRAREANEGGKAVDAIGEESLAFHKRVRDGFREVARREPGRVVVVDATRALGEVLDEVWGVVKGRL